MAHLAGSSPMWGIEGTADPLSIGKSCDVASSRKPCPSKKLVESFHWLKYGEKLLRDRKTVRTYYRCSAKGETGCEAKKMVDVAGDSPESSTAHFRDSHNHPCVSSSQQASKQLLLLPRPNASSALASRPMTRHGADAAAHAPSASSFGFAPSASLSHQDRAAAFSEMTDKEHASSFAIASTSLAHQERPVNSAAADLGSQFLCRDISVLRDSNVVDANSGPLRLNPPGTLVSGRMRSSQGCGVPRQEAAAKELGVSKPPPVPADLLILGHLLDLHRSGISQINQPAVIRALVPNQLAALSASPTDLRGAPSSCAARDPLSPASEVKEESSHAWSGVPSGQTMPLEERGSKRSRSEEVRPLQTKRQWAKGSSDQEGGGVVQSLRSEKAPTSPSRSRFFGQTDEKAALAELQCRHQGCTWLSLGSDSQLCGCFLP